MLVLGAILALVLSGCDNELDLVADWQEIPVVYGFLSRSDTAQYIRIEKAFLDPSTSAFIVAQNPDSLYFPNAIVELEQVATGDVVTLERVDGEAEGYPREAGIFANAPNILYKVLTEDAKLFTDNIYRLTIKDESGRIITAVETSIVGDYELQVNVPVNPIPFRYDNAIKVTWKSQEKTAYFYDAKALIYIEEVVGGDPSTATVKTLEWELERGIVRSQNSSSTSTFMPGLEFYRFFQKELEVIPNVSRKFLHLDLIIDAGAAEIYEYLAVGQANAGITGAEYVADYSNIPGGIGLLSSRYQLRAPNFEVTDGVLDSLRIGIYTKDLNFQ